MGKDKSNFNSRVGGLGRMFDGDRFKRMKGDDFKSKSTDHDFKAFFHKMEQEKQRQFCF